MLLVWKCHFLSLMEIFNHKWMTPFFSPLFCQWKLQMLYRSTYNNWLPAQVHRSACAGLSACLLSPLSRQVGFQLRSKGHPGCQWKCNPASFTFYPLQHLELMAVRGLFTFRQSEYPGTLRNSSTLWRGKQIFLLSSRHLQCSHDGMQRYSH